MKTFRGCEGCWNRPSYCNECTRLVYAGRRPTFEVSDSTAARHGLSAGAPGEKTASKDLETAPTFADLGESVGALVDEKQRAYGDSFGKSGQVLRILYPDGIRPEQLDDALAITRVVDKLFRIATDRDALGESPWRDIAGYALLATRRVESAKKGGAR